MRGACNAIKEEEKATTPVTALREQGSCPRFSGPKCRSLRLASPKSALFSMPFPRCFCFSVVVDLSDFNDVQAMIYLLTFFL